MWRHDKANMEKITDSEAIHYFGKAIQSSAADLDFGWEIPQCCHQILTWQLSSNVREGLALQICLFFAPAVRSASCSCQWVPSSTALRSNFWFIWKFDTEKNCLTWIWSHSIILWAVLYSCPQLCLFTLVPFSKNRTLKVTHLLQANISLCHPSWCSPTS